MTQQNLHIANLTELVEIVEAEGRRRQMILTCGGPRVSNELAKELGYDAGFSKGTYPHHVASFIVRELAARTAAGVAAARRSTAGRALLGADRPGAAAGAGRAGEEHRQDGDAGGDPARARGGGRHASGVTSIGRDGEAARRDRRADRQAADRACRRAASWRAPTRSLRASGLAHERLAQTGVRTPLGEVVIARLSEPGAVEVAGPSAAEDLRAVSDAMLASAPSRC